MIGVNANSYGKFMHGKYKDPWSATQNGTYAAAAFFFFKEEKLGKHALGKVRARRGEASGTPTVATAAAAGGKTKSVTGGTKPKLPDVSCTTLADHHTCALEDSNSRPCCLAECF